MPVRPAGVQSAGAGGSGKSGEWPDHRGAGGKARQGSSQSAGEVTPQRATEKVLCASREALSFFSLALSGFYFLGALCEEPCLTTGAIDGRAIHPIALRGRLAFGGEAA